MGRMLLVSFLGAFGLLVLFGSLGVVVLWRLRRRNRLHRSWATAAPVRWLVAPSRAARLHRRLRRAVRTAQYRSPSTGRERVPHASVEDLTASLLEEALVVDEQLAFAARAPLTVRRHLLDVAAPQVASLEGLAARLAVLVSSTARPGGVPAAQAVLTLEDRLEALEVSRQEIADLEAALFIDVVAEDATSDRDRDDRSDRSS